MSKKALVAVGAGVVAALSLVGVYKAGLLSKKKAGAVVPHIAAGAANPKMQGDKAVHWPRRQVTLQIDQSVASLGEGAREAVMAAAGAWLSSGAKVPDLAFDSGAGAPGRDGVNGVYWGEITMPGHERDVALTYSYIDSASGRIVEADVVLNKAYRFAVLPAGAPGAQPQGEGAPGCDGAYDVQSVVTHEMGHFFGLGEDAQNTGTTMYQLTKPCTVNKRSLQPDDTKAIVTMYDNVEGNDTEQQGAACSLGGRDQAGGAGAGLLALCMAMLIRRRSCAGAAA